MSSNEPNRSEQVHDTLDLLIRTMRMHHRNIEKQLECSSLHRGQRKLLMYLSAKGTPLSQREIADEFDVSPACIARMLKSLAADGYITRTDDESDLRRNNVRITEKGLLVTRETRRLFDEFDRMTFEGLSNEEIGQLNALISRLHSNLRAYEENCTDKNHPPKGSASH